MVDEAGEVAEAGGDQVEGGCWGLREAKGVVEERCGQVRGQDGVELAYVLSYESTILNFLLSLDSIALARHFGYRDPDAATFLHPSVLACHEFARTTWPALPIHACVRRVAENVEGARTERRGARTARWTLRSDQVIGCCCESGLVLYIGSNVGKRRSWQGL